ncbi:MAG: HdeD family acid-resistance protein [Nocardioidaceae bacterium]
MTDPTYLSPMPTSVTRLSNHWGLVVTFGAVTVLLGLVLAFWPQSTLVVLAVLFALQLLVHGIYQLVYAIGAGSLEGGMRGLIGLAGVLSILVGLLFLRSPLQTLAVIAVLLGVWFVVCGLLEAFTALMSETHDKGWRVAMGVLSVLVGGFILVDPKLSLTALVVVVAAWLLVYGAVAIVAGFRLRALQAPAAPSGPQVVAP